MSETVLDRYGVIGHPVEHSRSPIIHGLFAQQTGQKMRYERVAAALDQFGDTTRTFFAQGGRGLNVTVPFKLEAFALADTHSERACLAGAVNTLRHEGGRLFGDNTDGIGLLRDLERLAEAHAVPLAGARILILGAGGAVRGITGPLLAARPEVLVIASRERAKAQALLARFEVQGALLSAAALQDLRDEPFDLIVHATSAGLDGLALDIPQKMLGRARLVYDLSYGEGPADRSTPFLRAALASGAQTCSDGLGMLVEQAAESFWVWRGVRPDTAPVLKTLRQRFSALP